MGCENRVPKIENNIFGDNKTLFLGSQKNLRPARPERRLLFFNRYRDTSLVFPFFNMVSRRKGETEEEHRERRRAARANKQKQYKKKEPSQTAPKAQGKQRNGETIQSPPWGATT